MKNRVIEHDENENVILVLNEVNENQELDDSNKNQVLDNGDQITTLINEMVNYVVLHNV